jgi:diguanylate cyclase (GGDEF)-like protein
MGAPFSQAQILHLMKTEFSRARRHSYPLACVLIRIDRLERWVDRYGQSLRDTARQRLGQLVADKTREHDHVGFVSDERYLLVLPHTDGPAAQRVAERIRLAFADQEFTSEGERVSLSLSLGVVACADRETMFFDTLISQAELAQERAAEAGGDRTVLFRKEKFLGSDPEGEPSL